MNRAQRRAGKVENLYEWLKNPEAAARRGEVWEVIWRCLDIHELHRRRQRPLARFQRFMSRVFRLKTPQVDEMTGDSD